MVTRTHTLALAAKKFGENGCSCCASGLIIGTKGVRPTHRRLSMCSCCAGPSFTRFLPNFSPPLGYPHFVCRRGVRRPPLVSIHADPGTRTMYSFPVSFSGPGRPSGGRTPSTLGRSSLGRRKGRWNRRRRFACVLAGSLEPPLFGQSVVHKKGCLNRVLGWMLTPASWLVSLALQVALTAALY